MPDAEVPQFAVGFGAVHRLGDTEIRVPDHTEDGVYTPVGHGLNQDVADRAGMRSRRRSTHVHAVLAHVHGIGEHIEIGPTGRLAGERVKVESVPGATNLVVLQGALAQRTALVGAAVVDGTETAVQFGQRHGLQAHRADRHLTLIQRILISCLVPDQFLFAHSGIAPA